MKRITTTLIVILITMTSFAQTQEENTEVATEEVNLLSHTIGKYRLFNTTNMWTFIKLDTQNGRMWQVQYDTKGDNRFEMYLNIIPLVDEEKEVNNRFTLYPTQNMWTFILLDQLDGRMWQVQWSTKPDNIGMWPIE